MYSWLWRKLPGFWLVKVLILLILLAGFISFCYFVFFPWLDSVLFSENETNLQ